jgi:hypothetical protein
MMVLLVTLNEMMFSSTKLLNKECGTIAKRNKQPAKSPDSNVADLLFFRALQAKQWSLGSKTLIDGLLLKSFRLSRNSNLERLIVGFLYYKLA